MPPKDSRQVAQNEHLREQPIRIHSLPVTIRDAGDTFFKTQAKCRGQRSAIRVCTARLL